MPQYAYYNSTIPAPSPVLGWYDTDEFQYPSLPASSDLLAVSAAEWSARLSNPSGWAVESSALVAYTPPAPSLTPAQTAAADYAAFIAVGLTVTSTGTPALNGVYAIDPNSQANISAEAQFVGTFSEFTNGSTTALVWQLQNGSFVTFPSTMEFTAFAKVAAQIVAAAKLAAAQIAAGQSATMPAPSATIL